MYQIWNVSSTSHPKQASCPKISKFIIQDARRPPFWNLQKFEYLQNYLTYVHQICYVSSTPHPEQASGLKISKFKIQDGRWQKNEIY